MSIDMKTELLSSNRVLFDWDEHARKRIARSLEEQQVGDSVSAASKRLARAGQRAVRRGVARLAADLIDVDLTPLMLAGWGKGRSPRCCYTTHFGIPRHTRGCGVSYSSHHLDPSTVG